MSPPIPRPRRVAASAPARICLAGESLDWMIGGPSVVAALPLRTTVAITAGTASAETVLFHAGHPINATRQTQLTKLGVYQGDPMDLLQAAAHTLAEPCHTILPGSQITSTTRVPVGAGVSSSAALAVAACAALLLAGRDRLPAVNAVAHAAYAAESREQRTGAGWMDFLACAYGGVNHLSGGADRAVVRLREEIGCPVILIDTLDRRSTARTLVGKHERFHAGDDDLRHYTTIAPRIVADLAELLSIPDADYPAIGELLTETQHLLRDKVRCSTPITDECVTRCLRAGAYGAKITGSGHGGCLFALAPVEMVPAVRASLSDLPVHVMLFTTGEPHGVVILPSESEEPECLTCPR